jgi:hypothetical protein
MLDQNTKHTERLRLNFDWATVEEETLGGGIELESAKPQTVAAVARHGSPPLLMTYVLILNEQVLMSKSYRLCADWC